MEQSRADEVVKGISEASELRRIYRDPSHVAVAKDVGRIDPSAAEFLARSPLCVIASTDGASVDASPRGGPPGFVKVLGPHLLAFGDLTGNNRLDTYTNVVHNRSIGMIFLVPGAEETLRVNGQATISEHEELRQRCAIDGRVPKVVVAVEVKECYLHCGAALRRARLWDADTWSEAADVPSAGRIYAENLGLGDDAVERIDADLQHYYAEGVWKVGGADPD